MKSLEKIRIEVCWTDKLEESFINDFIKVHNKVFKSNFDEKRFKKKYMDNIYGPSIIILAYFDDLCVGTRAFWRNDINNIKAYQPCDTAVLENYRGYGIFTQMTKQALETIGNDTLVYNFPNNNSYPGYIKLGWILQDRRKYKLYNPSKDYIEIDDIDSNYLKWLISDQSNNVKNSLYYTQINGSYYLIKRRKANFFLIIGMLDSEYIQYFQKARFPICFCYSRKGFLGRGIVTVIRNFNKDIHIPIYKIDTLF